tara:strand:- start:9434 stop:12532 length:3099 start_codon:yes stop_codon:yes gene_type:complete
MNKTPSYLTNIFSIILLALFTIIFVTENTNFINNNYKSSIISTLEKNINLRIKIDDIDVEWNGLEPTIIFHKIKLIDKETNKEIISGESLISKLDLYQSIIQNRFVPKEFNIINTKLSLKYSNRNLYFKNKNIFELKDKFFLEHKAQTDFSALTFRMTDSSIILNNLPYVDKYILQNMNLVIVSQDNNLKIFTTFNHSNINEVVHIAADLNLTKNKKPTGTIYSRGVNLNLKKFPIEMKNIKTSAQSINYTLWSNLDKGEFKTLSGKVSANSLDIYNRITEKKLELTNIKSDLIYNSKNKTQSLLLNDFSFNTQSHNYSSNQFFLKIKNNRGTDLSFKSLQIIDFKNLLNVMPNISRKNINKVLKNLKSGEVKNANFIDLNILKKMKFTFSFKNIQLITKNAKPSINNISGNSTGTFTKGFLKLNSPNLGITHEKFGDKEQIINLNALINYRYKGNNLYMNAQNFTVNDLYKFNMSSSYHRNELDFRVTSNGKIEFLSKTINKYNIKSIDKNLVLSGKYFIDIRGKNYLKKKNLYGVLEVSELGFFDKKTKLAITNLNTRINFSGSHIVSTKNKFKFKNKDFDMLINTNILNGTTKYFLQANGKINTELIKDYFKIKDEGIVNGESFAKIRINLTPEYLFERVNFNLISDLKGVAINIIGPLRKTKSEKKLLNVNYTYKKDDNNNVKVFFDKYKMLVSFKKDIWYLNVDSPNIKGNINWPIKNSEKNRVVARLRYLNMNQFNYFSEPSDLPYLNLVSKQVKVGNLHLDNVEVLTAPTENSLIFERFNFNNINLSMDGSGEWSHKNKKMETFFKASFSSNNLGRALKGLGYTGLIRKGKIKSELVGLWNGSPDQFKFSNFDGTLKFKSNNGEVLQVTKQTQAIGQLLGLFSISALPKRLSLDFSDFFSTGLKYDDMEGDLHFKAGKADTKKLILQGTFGEMRLTGETNLIKETYNQTLLFIPDLSSTSLITGAVVGGPVGAVAAIFYDKFLKEIGEKALGIDTNKVAAIEYSVTGPWEDPEVKVTESFKPILN